MFKSRAKCKDMFAGSGVVAGSQKEASKRDELRIRLSQSSSEI